MMFVTSHIQQKSADCFEAASCGDLAHAAGQCVSYPGPPCYLSVYVHYALDHCDAGSYLHDEFGSALWECLSWYWSALITCCMQEKDHFFIYYLHSDSVASWVMLDPDICESCLQPSGVTAVI